MKTFERCDQCGKITEVDINDNVLMLNLFPKEILDVRKKAMINMSKENYQFTLGKIYGGEVKCFIEFDGENL